MKNTISSDQKTFSMQNLDVPQLSESVSTNFKKNLGLSALAHICVFTMIILGMKLWEKDKSIEKIQWIELSSNFGQSSASPSQPHHQAVSPPPAQSTEPQEKTTADQSSPTVEEPPPIPQPQVKIESPVAQPIEPIKVKPKAIEKPKVTVKPKTTQTEKNKTTVKSKTPVQPTKPKIKISKKTVTRTIEESNTSKTTKKTSSSPVSSSSAVVSFDPSKFAKNILSKFPTGTGTGLVTTGATGANGTSGAPDSFGWYKNLIFQAMYGAWQPPLGLDEGLTSDIRLRVEKNGVISQVSLASSSGNKFMDDSAIAAAKRVQKLPPLPKGLGGDFADITVHFKVQKP